MQLGTGGHTYTMVFLINWSNSSSRSKIKAQDAGTSIWIKEISRSENSSIQTKAPKESQTIFCQKNFQFYERKPNQPYK